MADGVKVKLSMKGVQKALKSQGPFKSKVAKKIVAKYALLIQGEAKINLRSDPRRIDDGILWNSIQILLVGLGAQVFTKNEYAAFVHWGTGIHGENPKGGHRLTPWVYFDEKTRKYHVTSGMEPNMFFKNAFDKYAPLFFADMRKALAISDTSFKNMK